MVDRERDAAGVVARTGYEECSGSEIGLPRSSAVQTRTRVVGSDTISREETIVYVYVHRE